MTSNGLEQEQRLSLQVYESHMKIKTRKSLIDN